MRHGELFCRVGCAHTHQLVIVMHALYEGGKQCRLPVYDRHYLIGAADRAPVGSFQRLEDRLFVHEEVYLMPYAWSLL